MGCSNTPATTASQPNERAVRGNGLLARLS
jgi:hypothetical protein